MKTQFKLPTCVAFLVSMLLPMGAVAFGNVNVHVLPGDAGTIAASDAAMESETAADANAPDSEQPQPTDAENVQEPSEESVASEDADETTAANEADESDEPTEADEVDAADGADAEDSGDADDDEDSDDE